MDKEKFLDDCIDMLRSELETYFDNNAPENLKIESEGNFISENKESGFEGSENEDSDKENRNNSTNIIERFLKEQKEKQA